MESVFSGAYCTVAATAAADSYAGFLERNINPEYIHIQNASGKPFYISTDVDDFDIDVGDARLNTRAWVMQEQVLSRRTIYFSSNQIYWECGEGVYCENLTQPSSPYTDRYFILDPSFPNRLLESGKGRTLNCISFLFQEYSKRNLTMPSDRSVAISGLVDPVADALDCHSAYGTFQKYFHRNLLWQASDGKMEEIAYDYHMPSWSWMAYSGGIQFLGVSLHDVDWVDHLQFDKECNYAIIADLGRFHNCAMEPDGDHFVILSLFTGREKGWIRYDVENGKDLGDERCFVIGRTEEYYKTTEERYGTMTEVYTPTEKYYILVARPTSTSGEYRRVGIGLVNSDRIVKERLRVQLV
ncbi:TOL-like protein [Paraphaeosphaeria sporulosa]